MKILLSSDAPDGLYKAQAPRQELRQQEIVNLINTLNAETFLGCPPRTVRMFRVSSEREAHGVAATWLRTYVFEYSRAGFSVRTPEQAWDLIPSASFSELPVTSATLIE